jgi:hypothetical protein
MADRKDYSEFRNIPIVNPNTAKIADLLNIAKKYADQYYVKENVPLIGGMKLGETLLGDAPEEVQRYAEGNYPLKSLYELKRQEGSRTNIFKTGRAAPTFDVAANLVAPLIPAAKTALTPLSSLAKLSKLAKSSTIEANILKGFKDEGNFRRVGNPQSTLEKFGLAGNDQGILPGGLIENAGRITRRSDPNDIKAQAEFIEANLNNPEFNKALALAKKHNPDFDLKAIADMPESSIRKQHAIAKTYDLLTKEAVPPQLKQAIYEDYLAKHPEMMKREGIKDYDDLVTKSYGQLRKEIDQQFDDMVKGGMKLSYHQGDANYLDSKEMLRDALVNNHLYTFRGGDVHPLLNDLDPHYGLNSNEKFRAVHDFFGHGTTGATFGRKGEELAYGAHAQTLSPLARIAAAAETRGQNSFVNYSGLNADLEADMISARIARDEAKHQGKSTEQADEILRDLGKQWQYAKQQGLALPPEMLEANYAGSFPEYIKAHIYPEQGITSKGYHYSNLPDLEETDPTKFGLGITSEEATRLAYPGAVKNRTYFYGEPGMRESGLGRHQYEADLEHLYDAENDPLRIMKMAHNFNRNKYGILDKDSYRNEMERLMQEAGYHGYFNNEGVGISFNPQRVREFSSD